MYRVVNLRFSSYNGYSHSLVESFGDFCAICTNCQLDLFVYNQYLRLELETKQTDYSLDWDFDYCDYVHISALG